MTKIRRWLREESQGLADNLTEINRRQFFKNSIGGFGMKGRVLDVLHLLRTAMFPSIYEKNVADERLLAEQVNSRLNAAAIQLNGIIREVMVNQCEKEDRKGEPCDECVKQAENLTVDFLGKLELIRRTLSTDIQAAYNGDPAALYLEEIMLCYPSLEAVSIYRIAHELFRLGVPMIPRIMTEHAHQLTGIDIHPGATIGEYFFIDHGTGVVIGETCVIGDNVKLYQGVTLGAKSFELDEDGNPVKGIKRHPNIEDDVIIYSGATILGGDTTIGKGSVIGGNVWLTQSVPPYSTVYNAQPSPIIK